MDGRLNAGTAMVMSGESESLFGRPVLLAAPSGMQTLAIVDLGE
jgi:hypothetical protein